MNAAVSPSVPPRLADAPPVPSRRPVAGLRWYICGLLFLVTAINYVDRVSLGAMQDAVLKKELGWGATEFGWVLFWFHVSYGLMFGIAGRFIDHVGVRTGLAVGVVVWSLAAMGHSLASTVVGFAIARFVLGIGEATNFPAAIKAVAEWFPRRERSFATGIFNMGTNVGAMLQGPIAFLAVATDWRAVFVLFGLLGFAWLAIWWRVYRAPEEHPLLSAQEAALIRADQEPPAQALQIPWPTLLRYREAWAFCLGKMLTDPVWWFFLYWLMSYLKNNKFPDDLQTAAWGITIIYICADLGSILGGWLAGRYQSRLPTMLLFAAMMPVLLFLDDVRAPWLAVAILSLANAAHQGWSANMFTIASDAFPKRAVGSVVGFGAMCGGIGGMFMPLIAGAVLTLWPGDYATLFLICGIMHPIAWIGIRLLAGKTVKPIDLDRGLRTAFSPALLAGGVALIVAGAGLTFATWRFWELIVERMQKAEAAGFGVAAGILTILMGVALAYASREQRVPAAVR